MKARITKLSATVTKLPQASTGTPAFFSAARVCGMLGGIAASAMK